MAPWQAHMLYNHHHAEDNWKFSPPSITLRQLCCKKPNSCNDDYDDYDDYDDDDDDDDEKSKFMQEGKSVRWFLCEPVPIIES